MQTFEYKRIRVDLELLEPMFATASSSLQTQEERISNSAPNRKQKLAEVEAVRIAIDKKLQERRDAGDEVEAPPVTIFPCNKDGNPIMHAYQIKGFLCAAATNLRRGERAYVKDLQAHDQVLKGQVFPDSIIKINLPEGQDTGVCSRPLRKNGKHGPETCIAVSETAPVGTTMSFEIEYLPLKLDGDPRRKALSAAKTEVNKIDKARKAAKKSKDVALMERLEVKQEKQQEAYDQMEAKLDPKEKDFLRLCLEELFRYGRRWGLLQWRTSGKGRFNAVITDVV